MISVSAAIVEEGGRVLIARRAPGERLAGLWEFPGGKREPGETDAECAVRECQEELGVTLEILSVFDSFVWMEPGKTIRFVFLRARILRGQPVPSVHDAFAWVAKEDLNGYCFAPPDVPVTLALCKETRQAKEKPALPV